MDKIEVRVLDPFAMIEAEREMALAARLTQHGEKMKSMADVMAAYNKGPSTGMIMRLSGLPHPTLQKFGTVSVVVVGASRRFLAQITRHQNEVKFMSASLQYSDYAEDADFTLPYELMNKPDAAAAYLKSCTASMRMYYKLRHEGIDNDTCGYMAPQGLRNVLLISATPYQWKHMISQRICRRNTPETRYVMLRIWEALLDISPMFQNCGPSCMVSDRCAEGAMSCANRLPTQATPTRILHMDFPLLCREEEEEENVNG